MSLAEVAPSAAAALGARGFHDTLGFGAPRHVVILLIDGLGWELLRAHLDDAPVLAAAAGAPMPTVFPTTTATALGSLGTGLLPGMHGLVGGTFWLPEADVVLNPLTWSTQASPLAVQPEPTVFERLTREGVVVTTIADPKFADSGLTRAALRGGGYRGVDLRAEGASALVAATSGAGRTLSYVYWGALDRVGHVQGAGSAPWRQALREADAIAGSIADALPPDAVLLVTADHGMVNCPRGSRIAVDADPALMAGVRLVAGEPRVRQVYVHEAADAVARRWAQALGPRAQVLTREHLIDTGLVGEVDEGIEERFGDVIAIAREDTSLTTARDARVSGLLGQHGALTSAERAIPALWFRTD